MLSIRDKVFHSFNLLEDEKVTKDRCALLPTAGALPQRALFHSGRSSTADTPSTADAL